MPDAHSSRSGETAGRIWSIALVDCRFRFRKTAGLVLMLAIAAGVYLIVPDVKTGVTLLEIGRQRVIYNSAAIAFGTSMFCSIILLLVGYYLVSNSFRRDILSRTGFIIAATPVTNLEYVAGKFLGSTIYLTSAMLMCMLSSMVMFLIRGEGALEPFTFLWIYLWMVLPGIVYCAAFAVLFESVPFLSGRFGDVLYFLVCLGIISVPAAFMERDSYPGWVKLIDIVGLGTVIGQLMEQFHTKAISVGQSEFDPAKGAILYQGLAWGPGMIFERFGTLLVPVALVALAQSVFHRFNPVRLKSSGPKSRRHPVAWANRKLKAFTRVLAPLAGRANAGGSPVRADVLMTFLMSPVAFALLVGSAVASLFIDIQPLREGFLPAVVAVMIVTVADVVTRDSASGLRGLLFSMPRLKSWYVPLKFLSALIICAGFTIVPLIRLIPIYPGSAASLAIGTCFIASAAVGFGLMTNSRKAYMAVFLMFLYIALNARTDAPVDFAGFNGCATALVQSVYGLLAIGTLVIASAVHRRRVERL